MDASYSFWAAFADELLQLDWLHELDDVALGAVFAGTVAPVAVVVGAAVLFDEHDWVADVVEGVSAAAFRDNDIRQNAKTSTKNAMRNDTYLFTGRLPFQLPTANRHQRMRFQVQQ